MAFRGSQLRESLSACVSLPYVLQTLPIVESQYTLVIQCEGATRQSIRHLLRVQAKSFVSCSNETATCFYLLI